MGNDVPPLAFSGQITNVMGMPEASPLSPLADYLDQQRGKITSTWMDRVRADKKIRG